MIEENVKQGGLGSAVLEMLEEADVRNVGIRRMGLPDTFVEQGPVSLLKEKYGLNTAGILKEARYLLDTSLG